MNFHLRGEGPQRTQMRKGLGVLIVLALSLLVGWWLVQQ